MKKQVAKSLLMAGAFFCAFLTGCADKEESADSSMVSLQELAVDMDSVGGYSENKQTGTEGDTEGTVEKQGEKKNESWASEGVPSGQDEGKEPESGEMKFAGAKELLATFPNSLEELATLEEEYPVYIILHGIQHSGEENLETFREKLEAGEAAELIVVQFTVEGDAILDYYDYEGALMYRWQDISRDGFGGTGEKYFETVYEAAWFSEEADTEGNLYLSFYGLCEGDMVVELFQSDTGKIVPSAPDFHDREQDGIGEQSAVVDLGTAEPGSETPEFSAEIEICVGLPLAK